MINYYCLYELKIIVLINNLIDYFIKYLVSVILFNIGTLIALL